MSEDVKKLVGDLTTLYYEGDKTVNLFIQEHKALVKRQFSNRIDYTLSVPQAVSEDDAQDMLDEYDIYERTNKFQTRWINAVSSILDKLPQVRFRMRFDSLNEADCEGVAGSTESEQLNANVIKNKLDNIRQLIAALQVIIIELEEGAEKSQKVEYEVTANAIEPARYSKPKRTIFFAGKAIKFKKSATYTPAICELLFNHPRQKLWQLKDFQSLWDELYDFVDLKEPNDWHRVYETIRRVNDRVREKTKIDDLFDLTTTSVRINPAYLKQAKKSQ